jgi:hypothetical protein
LLGGIGKIIVGDVEKGEDFFVQTRGVTKDVFTNSFVTMSPGLVGHAGKGSDAAQ